MSLSKMLQEYRDKKREFPTYEELAALAETEQCADPIVERNVSLLRQRSTVGVQKYGTTLADNKLPLRAWLNHALEEALDQANYLQAAMAEIDSSIASQVGQNEQGLRAALQKIAGGTLDNHAEPYREIARDALQAAPVQAQEPIDGRNITAWNIFGYQLCCGGNQKAVDDALKEMWKILDENHDFRISVLDIDVPAEQDDATELTDSQIKAVADNYARYVQGAGYDVTHYECPEDFYNCVRACAAVAAKASPAPQ